MLFALEEHAGATAPARSRLPTNAQRHPGPQPVEASPSLVSTRQSSFPALFLHLSLLLLCCAVSPSHLRLVWLRRSVVVSVQFPVFHFRCAHVPSETGVPADTKLVRNSRNTTTSSPPTPTWTPLSWHPPKPLRPATLSETGTIHSDAHLERPAHCERCTPLSWVCDPSYPSRKITSAPLRAIHQQDARNETFDPPQACRSTQVLQKLTRLVA